MAFERLEPFGRLRLDFMIAQLTSVIANAFGEKKGGGKFEPRDFVYIPDEDEREEHLEPWERMLATVKMLNKALGGNTK